MNTDGGRAHGMNKIEIQLGALAPSISQQLRKANIAYDAKQLRLLQKDSDAITLLLIRGYISASMAATARIKLMRRMTSQMEGSRIV